MIPAVFSLLTLAATASGAYSGNLNYRSPSLHHASLGVSINKVAKRTHTKSPWDAASLKFTHGVASGDPLDHSVILWTRVAPNSDNDRSNITVEGYVPLFDHSNEVYVSKSDRPVCVEWKLTEDKSCKKIVDSGTVYTSSDVDYTVKVEAKKLSPYTNYCRSKFCAT